MNGKLNNYSIIKKNKKDVSSNKSKKCVCRPMNSRVCSLQETSTDPRECVVVSLTGQTSYAREFIHKVVNDHIQ